MGQTTRWHFPQVFAHRKVRGERNKSGVLVFWAECLRDALPSSSLSGAIVNNSHWEQEVHKGWQRYSGDRQRSRALKKATCVGGEKVYSLQQLTHFSPLLSTDLRERGRDAKCRSVWCNHVRSPCRADKSQRGCESGKKKFKEGIFQQSGDTVGIPRCHGPRVCVCMIHSPWKATDNNGGLSSSGGPFYFPAAL